MGVMGQKMVEEWVEGYIRAWNTNNPEEIAQLFSAAAVYKTGPFDEPWSGREIIVANWLNRQDEAGKFKFRYQVLAAGPGTGIIQGWTEYIDPAQEYSNIWLVRFDSQHRCTEFTEWWVARK